MPYNILQCIRPECRFRFHAPSKPEKVYACPKCGSATHIVIKNYENSDGETTSVPSNSPPVEVLLDNIRSTYNVGSIFRASDGAGVRFIHLCGITPTPDHPKIIKTALGAEYSIPWVQSWNAIQTVLQIKNKGYQIWALERVDNSISIYDLESIKPQQPILLVVGNEVSGVDPGILPYCDKVIHIPMLGIKRSLNVSSAFSVAIYTIRFYRK